MPKSETPPAADKIVYVDAVAGALASAGAPIAVMSARNSGYWAAVKPLP